MPKLWSEPFVRQPASATDIDNDNIFVMIQNNVVGLQIMMGNVLGM